MLLFLFILSSILTLECHCGDSNDQHLSVSGWSPYV